MEARVKKYVIPLTPRPWQRARLNGTKFYDSQVQEKIAYGLYMQREHGDEELFVKPILVEVSFYMPIPKSISKRKTTIYHASKPDIDNLLKLLFDAARGVVFKDDNIISSLTARKLYDTDPRTEFIVSEIMW